MKITKKTKVPVCFLVLLLFSCKADLVTDQTNDTESKVRQLPEDVLMQVSFSSKTTTYTKLADEAAKDGLDEDAKHFVMSAAVPVVRQDKQLFRIFKDSTYELTIDIENPDFNPAREAFRDETVRNDWELGKLIINSSTITAYDVSGGVIFTEDNSQNPFFNRLVEKIMSDDYFASHVNIGNALFRVSGGAENYLDPKLKSFFLSAEATTSRQDEFLIFKENISEKMRHWGHPITRNHKLTTPSFHHESLSLRAKGDSTVSYTLDETQQMIEDRVSSWNAGKDESLINVYTAIDSTKNELSAEVTYAGDEQVLGLTFYELKNDEDKTIKTAYTEDYETNPTYDLDMINVESIEYSDVQIINPLKRP